MGKYLIEILVNWILFSCFTISLLNHWEPGKWSARRVYSLLVRKLEFSTSRIWRKKTTLRRVLYFRYRVIYYSSCVDSMLDNIGYQCRTGTSLSLLVYTVEGWIVGWGTEKLLKHPGHITDPSVPAATCLKHQFSQGTQLEHKHSGGRLSKFAIYVQRRPPSGITLIHGEILYMLLHRWFMW